MVTEYNLLVAVGAIVVASLSMASRWNRDFPRGPAPFLRRPYDNQRHILTMVGADGRINPMRYEVFPTYPAALAHQRRLARKGQACVVTHEDSGEVRLDLATMLGPFGRIYY